MIKKLLFSIISLYLFFSCQDTKMTINSMAQELKENGYFVKGGFRDSLVSVSKNDQRALLLLQEIDSLSRDLYLALKEPRISSDERKELEVKLKERETQLVDEKKRISEQNMLSKSHEKTIGHLKEKFNQLNYDTKL
jgi:uncharacterized lipoprotein YajG